MELRSQMLTRFVPYLRFAPYAGIAFFAIMAAVQYGNARHWQKQYAASEKTVARYEGAQLAAIEINKAKVAQIESEYAAISEKAESDYEKSIADNRAALERWMRNQAAKVLPEAPEQAAPPQCPVKLCQEPKRPSFLLPISK